MANQNVTQLTQQTVSAAPTSLFYAVTGGTTDTGLPLSVLVNNLGLTGTPTTPTATSTTNTTQIASTAFVQSVVGSYAPLANPSFTGSITSSGLITINNNSAAVILNDPSGTSFPNILWTANGVNSWSLNSDNTNGVWVLNRYVSGSLASKPLSIAQATGLVTMVNGITNTPIGATTPNTGAFTTLSASSTVSGAGFSTYLASPPAIGGTAAAAGSFTTLGASGNDALSYTTTNALSLPTATVVTVTTFTKVFDRVNANFAASTGVFTAPATGIYLVQGNFSLASGTNAAGARLLVAVQVNGSTVGGAGATSYMQTATSMVNSINFSSLVSVTSGQTITVVLTQNSGATRALDGTTSNWVSINRVP